MMQSYRQNSDKLIRTGFKQLYSVDYAEIYNKFLDKSLKPNKIIHSKLHEGNGLLNG